MRNSVAHVMSETYQLEEVTSLRGMTRKQSVFSRVKDCVLDFILLRDEDDYSEYEEEKLTRFEETILRHPAVAFVAAAPIAVGVYGMVLLVSMLPL